MSLPDPLKGTFLPSTVAFPLKLILSICLACLFLFHTAMMSRFAFAICFSPSESLSFLIDSPKVIVNI